MHVTMDDLDHRLRKLERLVEKIAEKVGVESDPPRPYRSRPRIRIHRSN